jgi:hypothetical protein
VELLSRNLLTPGHEPFGSIDLNDESAALVSLRSTRDHFALSLCEFVEQTVPFVLSEPLDHHLLRGLCGNSAHLGERDLFDSFAFDVSPEPDHATEPIHLASELFGIQGVEVLASSAHHGLLEILNEEFSIDASIVGDGVEDSEGFCIHDSGASDGLRPPLLELSK